jgi:protein-S-isoprenylcysteine O-methyltransferase Ste14
MITKYDYIAIAALIFTILFNSAAVYLQKTKQIYSRFGVSAFTVHSVLISIPWAVFIGTEFLANKSTWRLEHTHPVAGYLIMAVALILFIAAIRQIGANALGNGFFFGHPLRNLKGIYSFIREPIYWSYTIWFAGIGLVTSLKVFFVFSAISIIGLIGFESWIERPTSSK